MDRQYPAYPLFMRLSGERAVVVGAGGVGTRKVDALVECGADVLVVAPCASERVRSLDIAGRLTLERRCYREGDLAGAVLAIAATPDRSVNERVYRHARAAGVPVNVVDTPALCTFTAPAVMRRGLLQIAVSTGAAAPSLAREIRRSLEQEYPSWWEDYLDLLAEVRVLVKERVPDPAVRPALLEAVRSADVLDGIASGDIPTPGAVYDRVVAPLLVTLQAQAKLADIPFEHDERPSRGEVAKPVGCAQSIGAGRDAGAGRNPQASGDLAGALSGGRAR